MGKGFNNYMTKKFFHPSSKDNIKRKWMAEQKHEFEKKQQEELLAQYQKEQEVLSNRALLGDEKAKLGLSFLYDAPPGLKKKEFEYFHQEPQQEIKFEWQRKYNAPREAYAKGDDEIRDQPFGIEVRNVRCIKCRQWGHVNTDKVCPLFHRNLTAEPEIPESSSSNILESFKEEGFAIKNSVLGRIMGAETDNHRQLLADEDEEDPEVKFLKSLTPKQKKKLLKKLNKLQNGPDDKESSKKSKKKKRKSESDSESSDDEQKPKKDKLSKVKKSKKSHKHKRSSSNDSDEDRSSQKHKKRVNSDSEDEVQRHRRDREERRHRDSHQDRQVNRDRSRSREREQRRHRSRSQEDRRQRSRSPVERRQRSPAEKRHRRREDRD